jgi:hypothetical protein
MFGPFLTANVVVANRVEPLFSLIRPGQHTGAREYVILALVLFMIPAGAWIAARPLWRVRARLGAGVAVGNAIVAVLLLLAFVAIAVPLGVEVYRCDILSVSNCD